MGLREDLIKMLEAAGNAADPTDDFRWNCRFALGGLADECIRQMEWARRIPAGPLDVGGFPLVVAAARDALTHWMRKLHGYNPSECEGCQFTVEAMQGIADISTPDNYKPLTAAPEGWKP